MRLGGENRDAVAKISPCRSGSSQNHRMPVNPPEEFRVSVERRVRPFRFAFVVDPDDVETVRRAFEINTYLWGGRLNPIIPLYQELPVGWPSHLPRRKRPSPIDVAQGYIKTFEPDYLVELADDMGKNLSFPDRFIVKEKDITYSDGTLGLTVRRVFNHEYSETYRFLQKDPFEAAFPVFKGLDLLSAATFGCYKSEDDPARRHFEQAFSPVHEVIDRKSYWNFVRRPRLSPLLAGLSQLHRGYYTRLNFFLCNPSSIQDLIDFWNLRALGWTMFPLPQKWADEHEIKKVVDENRGPEAGTGILKSSSVSRRRLHALTALLPTDDASVIFEELPQLWSRHDQVLEGTRRLDAWCNEDETEVTVKDGSLQLPVSAPHFFQDDQFTSSAHWANEVRLSHFSSIDRATSFPRLASVSDILATWQPEVTQHSDALVVRVRHSRDKKFWKLPRNFEVFKQWMHDRGYQAQLSGAGRIGTEMVRALGGIRSTYLIKCVDLIDFLNDLAHTGVESPNDDDRERRVRVGTAARPRLIELFRRCSDGFGRATSVKDAEDHLQALLDQSVFRVGLKLQCPHCFQRNWYALDDLSETLRCERCLQPFPYPASSPHDAKWEYRPIGPFATENYAQGSYSAILAVNFLLSPDFNRFPWCPGFEIRKDGLKTIECDFGIFAPERIGSSDLAFSAGEAKCGERRFSAKDYATCKAFVEAFPGSAFIFATTRRVLDEKEKRSIRAQVRQNRLRSARPSSPIVVLTRIELEASYAPARSWPKDVIKEYYDDHKSSAMQRLALATQRLYLS